jgi:hypothetical protein
MSLFKKKEVKPVEVPLPTPEIVAQQVAEVPEEEMEDDSDSNEEKESNTAPQDDSFEERVVLTLNQLEERIMALESSLFRLKAAL